MTEAPSTSPWPQRAVALALLGAVAGGGLARLSQQPILPAATTAIAALLVFVLAFGLLWDRDRLAVALGGAAALALVAAGGSHWSGPQGLTEGAYGLRLPSSLLAAAVAVPLFQAWLDGRADGGGMRYMRASDRAWTDLVAMLLALAFGLISFLVVTLLGALFKLIGITALSQLLERRYFVLPLLGAAVGGGGALARDQTSMISAPLSVLRFILSALMPVLALGLGLFLLALPFTGLESLWQATRNTTPILITCVAAALVLANAVIADTADHESRRRALRATAFVLVVANLPLAIIAAVSVSRRVAQYGWTPDRLWAGVIVAVALAYGIAGAWAALQPIRWMARVRAGNLVMGFVLAGIALLLATPLADFGAISARSQVARLRAGTVSVADFDWAALRHDFGQAGVAALGEMARSTSAAAPQARLALKSTDRWDLQSQTRMQEERRWIARNLFVIPRGADGRPRIAPPAISTNLANSHGCGEALALCVLVWQPGSAEAVAFVGIDNFGLSQNVQFRLREGRWLEVSAANRAFPSESDRAKSQRDARAALVAGRMETRKLVGTQLLIDGKPQGTALPPS